MCIQNVFNIETIESKDIENATFSTRYMAILLPAFIKAMFGFEAFTLVLIITIAWIVQKNNKKYCISTHFILCVSYIIYCTL